MLENSNKPSKTKEEYSRNVKLLKLKLEKLRHQREDLERKLDGAKRMNNDRVIAMKLGKFCRQRKFTPEMLFRFADRRATGEVDQVDFKAALLQLGIKLSADELNKMVLLIDEDISGKVTISEYYQYLAAFNMRVEPTSQEPFVVSGLKKMTQLLVQDTLGVKLDELISQKSKETADEQAGRDNRVRRLPRYKYMDYEEFYRFCSKNQPGMKDKELLSIFNRLDSESTGLVLIDDLRQFFKEGQKELDKKNARLIKKQEKPNDKENITPTKPPTLKEMLQLVLMSRTRKGRFHLNEFKALARDRSNKQEIGELFRSIDQHKQGSFDYNQILRYYLKKKDPQDNYNFAYQIMQLSLENAEKRIDQVLFTNKLVEGSEMTQTIFTEFMHGEFGVEESHSKLMYEELLSEYKVKRLDASHLTRKFRQVAKLAKTSNSCLPDLDNIISLNYFGTKGGDFLRKGCGTIVKNPMVALRFCVQLQHEIQKQNRQKWSDFQFGPSPNDERGLQSLIGLSDSTMSQSMPSEKELTWIRSVDLNFTEFYSPTDLGFSQGKFENGEFLSALVFLNKADKEFLNRQVKQPPPAAKELTAAELETAFTGLYPRVFHYFAKYGIYVFRLFVEDNWAYVLIDDLLPCTTKKELLCSTSVSKKYSWVPLIEKAYAKVKGGYHAVYGQTTLFQSLYELSHQAPKQFWLTQNITDQSLKDETWKTLCSYFPKDAPPKVSCYSSTHSGELQLNGAGIGLIGSQPIQLLYAVELGDIRLDNYHKSHRLLFLRKPEKHEDSIWNKNWSQQEPESRFFDYNDEIRDEIKKAKNYGLLLPTCLIINYSKFRRLYDSVFSLMDIMSWEGSRARDSLDQQKDGPLRTQYRLRLSQPSQLVLTIVSLENRNPRFEYSLTIAERPQQWVQSSRRLTVIHLQKAEQGNYQLFVRSKQQYQYSMSIYLRHTSYKFSRVPSKIDFEPIKELEKMAFNERSAGDVAMEYLETRFFRLPARKKTTCCC